MLYDQSLVILLNCSTLFLFYCIYYYFLEHWNFISSNDRYCIFVIRQNKELDLELEVTLPPGGYPNTLQSSLCFKIRVNSYLTPGVNGEHVRLIIGETLISGWFRFGFEYLLSSAL